MNNDASIVADHRKAGNEVAIIASIVAASLTTSITVPPILPKMMAHFATVPHAAVLVPMVVSLPFLVSVLVSPFLGLLSDRIDRRAMVIASSVLATLFGVSPYFLDSLPAILVARFLMGFATASLLLCTSALIGDLFEGAMRRKALGIKYAFLGITHVFVFIIIGHLGAHDWHNAFLIFLWGLVAALMITLFIPRNLRQSRTNAAIVPGKLNLPWSTLVPVFGGVFLSAATFDTLLTGVGFLLEERGLTGTVRAGYTASFASLGMLIGAAAFPSLRARLASRAIWVITFVLAATGYALLASVALFPATVAAMIIVGIGCGMVSPNSLDFLLGQVPPQARGRVTGLHTTFFFLGMACGPLIGVTFGMAIGSYNLLFWILVVALVLLAVLFALFAPRIAGQEAAHQAA